LNRNKKRFRRGFSALYLKIFKYKKLLYCRKKRSAIIIINIFDTRQNLNSTEAMLQMSEDDIQSGNLIIEKQLDELGKQLNY